MTISSSRRTTRAVSCLVLVGVAVAFAACKGDDDAPAEPPKLSHDALIDPEACVTCHADHYREWSGSMHAFAGIDPVFLAMNKRMQRETNGALGTFCVSCHAPMAVKMGLTKDGLNLAELDPKQLGITCYVCHNSEFNGGDFDNNPLVLIDDGKMRGGFSNPVPNTAHEAMYSPFTDHNHDSSALLCGTCHDVVTPAGAHIERTFAEWRKSRVAIEQRTTCGGCHMPESTGLAAQAPGVLVRKIHDHSMPGVDLALLPFPEVDAQRAGVQKSLDDALSARLCVTPDAATAGVHVEVTLRNDKVGHFWPSGSAQDRRAWVELEGQRAGATVFGSGQIGDRQAVSAITDPQLMLLRDRLFDSQDAPTEMFWQAARFESVLLPVASASDDSEASHARTQAYSFPGPMPESVKMRVKIRPLDFDLLDDLVASGDLDPGVAGGVSTMTLASTELTWTPGTDCVETRAR